MVTEELWDSVDLINLASFMGSLEVAVREQQTTHAVAHCLLGQYVLTELINYGGLTVNVLNEGFILVMQFDIFWGTKSGNIKELVVKAHSCLQCHMVTTDRISGTTDLM